MKKVPRIAVITLGNLESLYRSEEEFRVRALGMIADDELLQLHLQAAERAMNLADTFRQMKTDDENLKVVKILGMRVFNAFASSLRLALSGYVQNSTLIIRDIIETIFLLDLFSRQHELIEEWRFMDEAERRKRFAPVKVREALDERDGYSSARRAEHYRLFSELAGHPNMKSSWMMRPEKNGDAVIGPFMEFTALQAVLSEAGKLAILFGEVLDRFMPTGWEQSRQPRETFASLKATWIERIFMDTNEGVTGS